MGYFKCDAIDWDGGEEMERRARLAAAKRRAFSKVAATADAPSEYSVDCDAKPFMPVEAWRIVKHEEVGIIDLRKLKISLYLSKRQKSGAEDDGGLHRELEDKLVLNANVLDRLLASQQFIPEDWVGNTVCFRGTLFRTKDGREFIRVAVRDGGGWVGSQRTLSECCTSDTPAAILEV